MRKLYMLKLLYMPEQAIVAMGDHASGVTDRKSRKRSNIEMLLHLKMQKSILPVLFLSLTRGRGCGMYSEPKNKGPPRYAWTAKSAS